MLAKEVNDNAPILNERGALEFFASKLAPTVGSQQGLDIRECRHQDRLDGVHAVFRLFKGDVGR